MRFNLTCLFVTFLLLFSGDVILPPSLLASEQCRITVETILAARGETTVDDRLKQDIRELQSMFNYTSYRLLGRERLDLSVGRSGTVNLPGNRRLKITPHKIQGNRANISLQMMRQNRTEFQTQVQILNRGSLFVGGPNYLNGNLIFKISSTY